MKSRAIRVTVLVAIRLLFPAGHYYAKSSPQGPECSDSVRCAEMASTSLKSGDINLAIDYSKLQVGYAEDANNVADEEAAYESLASTYGTKHDYLRGLAWIDLALRLDPGDPAVQKILQKLTHATQGVQWPAQGGGTYAQYAGRAMWNSLCASAKSNGGVHFTLTAYRPGKAWRGLGNARR